MKDTIKFIEKSTFALFSFRIGLNYNSLGNCNVDCGVNNRPILALKVLTGLTEAY